MSPQQKCVTLEIARKLKEAGFPQDTERYWGNTVGQADQTCWRIEKPDWHDKGMEYLAAPDAQEIGVELPETLGSNINKKQIGVEEFVYDNPRRYQIQVSEYVGDAPPLPRTIFSQINENEAEARAACWLWLKEKNLV